MSYGGDGRLWHSELIQRNYTNRLYYDECLKTVQEASDHDDQRAEDVLRLLEGLEG